MEVIYNPLDARRFVRRALDAIRPNRLIFIEAIWPNLLAETKKRGIPAALIPRLSPRSEKRFGKARRWTGPIFRELDLLLLSDAEDIPRWTSLGAQPAQFRVTGNIKFDQAPQSPERLNALREILRNLGIADDAPILLAGSTFPGEERIVADAYCKLRETHPRLFLVIVPRHVERTNEVAADLTVAGLSFARRTAFAENLKSEIENLKFDCLVVNTTGELRDWYHLATVVFIGKSLTSIGGQNPVEAVAAGKPVVFGPHMENFQPLVAQWLAADAAIQVHRPEGARTANFAIAQRSRPPGNARSACPRDRVPARRRDRTVPPNYCWFFELASERAGHHIAALFFSEKTLSSRGLGHRPFTAVTRVRIPLGSLVSRS